MPRPSVFAAVCPLLASLLFLPPIARAAPPSFDPDAATPYFASGPVAEARRQFQLEAWADAARRFEAYLAAHPKAADRHQAAFLGAYAASRAGRFLDAAHRFDELVKSYPLLADHHRLYAARAYAAARQWQLSFERAETIAAGSPLDGEARLARAGALLQLKRFADAQREYRAYLESYPKSWRDPEVRYRLAEAIEAQAAARPKAPGKTNSEVDTWPEARALYRELYLHFPTESWGAQAAAHLKEALARDSTALTLSGAEHLERGLAFFETMRNPESEAELRAALAAGDLDGKKACVAAYHLAQSVFKARDRPRAAALFDAAVATCAKAPPDDPQVADLHMKSLYQGARCHAARGEGPIAAALFARAEAEHPSHSYADDARLHQAETWDAIAEKVRASAPGSDKTPTSDAGVSVEEYQAKSTALLGDLADRYPAGDMRSEALFRLFFRAWKAGKNDDARRWLETALAKVPREEGWWDAGRTLYWLGREAEREGRPDDARASYARCAGEYPLSYYALAALNRMREKWPREMDALVAELHKPLPTPADLAWHFAPRELFGKPGFLRGVELARLGLGSEARREFADLGIRAPTGKGAPAPSSDEPSHEKANPESAEELLWLVTVLYDRAGEYAQSHWIPRHTLTTYARLWPTGANRKRWLLSYPRGYAELLVDNAKKNGQPEALQFAIVREESAFDPLNESFANAIGLTQLTQAPAKRFAQGLPYTREALRDPAINVAIGARELGALWAGYHGNAPLTIAGYNAGEHAVGRWLKTAKDDEYLDEFIENIPYDETRGYTKRVLSSYFTYRWLYESKEPVPTLPLRVRPVPTK